MTDYSSPDWTCIHGIINHKCFKCHPPLKAAYPNLLDAAPAGQKAFSHLKSCAVFTGGTCDCGDGRVLERPIATQLGRIERGVELLVHNLEAIGDETDWDSVGEIKQRLAAIEQHHADVAIWITGLETKLQAIEQGQGALLRSQENIINALQASSLADGMNHKVLCERFDELANKQDALKQEQIFHNRHTSEDWASLRTAIDEVRDSLGKKLDAIQLQQDFKQNRGKPCRKTNKRK